jgi:hypothetical protein
MANFGVLCSPFELAEWQADNQLRPDLPMIFEHWDQQRDLDATWAKALSLGYRKVMLTWEPWTPTATGIGNAAQGALQPKWSNEAIARGDHDAYIRLMSKSIRTSGLDTVYIRWGHEFNGDWHPWRTTPDTFVAAMKRIVNIFKGGGTGNAKFIWSPNSSLYQDNLTWVKGVVSYWPGAGYVDYVGMTMIDYGPPKDHPVSEYAARFDLASRLFAKPLVASELNCSWGVRASFFTGLNTWIATDNKLALLVLSQPEVSRGQANGVTDGNMEWTLTDDPAVADLVARIKTSLNQSPIS